MILHVSGCHLHSTRCVKATTCVLLFFPLLYLMLPWFFFALPVHAHIYTYELTCACSYPLSLSLSLGGGFGVSCFRSDRGDPLGSICLWASGWKVTQSILESCHRHSKREPSTPSSPCGIVGNRAERVKPQNRGGLRSFLTAENFQPMWELQVLHWAIVHAYPGNQLCNVEGRPIRLRLLAL